MKVDRPAGVTAVAAAFFAAAAYLLLAGVIMLGRPGLVSMAAGAEFLGGLELAGPYMFLLAAAAGLAIAAGLWSLQRWARWLAILVALLGVFVLLPSVASAMLDFRMGRLLWDGVGTAVRVMIVWYLFQEPAGDSFRS